MDVTASALEIFADDALAVFDAADADRVTMFEMGAVGGGALVAATYPE